MLTILAHEGRDMVVTRSDVNTALFFLSFIGLYTQFHIYSGNKIIFPFAIPNMIGLFALFFVPYRQATRLCGFFCVLCLFALFYLISAEVHGFFESAMMKFVQLMISIFACFGLCTIVSGIPRERLQKILVWIAALILVISTLEVYFGLYPFMVAINKVLYFWRPQGFYIDTGRDVNYWGAVRPLVFSTEPSLVGIWGCVLMIGATMLSKAEDWKRYAVLISYVAALLYVGRSTTSLLILGGHLFAVLFDRRFGASKRLVLLGAGTLAVVLLTLTSAATMIGRYAEGTSFFARILGPYLTAVEALWATPIFGVGLGNEQLLDGLIMEIWGRANMLSASASYVQEWGTSGMLTNNFFWLWIHFGILGGFVFLCLILILVRQLGRFSMLMVILTSLGVWMTVGGFVDARSWFFVFFFVGCAILNERKATVG